MDEFSAHWEDVNIALGGTLATSGDVASFKVFVRLTTGNAAGSNTVTITRP